jgi:hypothetical protein
MGAVENGGASLLERGAFFLSVVIKFEYNDMGEQDADTGR